MRRVLAAVTALTAASGWLGSSGTVPPALRGAEEAVPCVPVEGKTGLILGQDFFSITNYTAALGPPAVPFGVMSYTALRGGKAGGLRGLRSPVNYGSGVQWATGVGATGTAFACPGDAGERAGRRRGRVVGRRAHDAPAAAP